ncbi:MAG TPA: GEVED domain-containing protein [Bacteroidales bacterium]
MKKFLPFLLILFIIGLFPNSMFSQDWIENLPKEKIDHPEELTFFEIQKAFNDYWEPFNVKNGYYTENGVEKKAPGWKQFKRWEWYWESRIDPTTGEFPDVNAADIRKEIRQSSNSRNVSGNWQSMGPTSSPGGYAGLGRINCVAFAEGELNRFYVGSASGGFWKTEDGGGSWIITNDEMDVLGVSDAFVITGTSGSDDTIYIATGDRDGGSMWSLNGGQVHDNNSIGVMKSVDGGASWTSTDLVWLASDKKTVNRLLKHPADNDIIYAAATDGVFKTTNGGTTWPLLASPADEFIDMEFNPVDPMTMYGSSKSGDIYLSDDGGTSWTKKLDVGGAGRVELAVSMDEPTWVYAVVSVSSKLEGIYKSEDSGDSYTQIFDGTIYPNFLLGYYCDGSVDGGQGGYDLCIAADPTDATTVFLGGVNTWKSTDGGVSWTISNMWTSHSSYNSCGAPVAHADKHALIYQPGTNDLFEGNDGGVYKTTDGGITWPYLGSGLVTSQLYRLGVSQTSSSSVIIGLQDNGSKSNVAGNWSDVLGGDGMECIIDYTDADVQYGELYNAAMYRTDDSWATSTFIAGDFTGSAAWVTPYVIDPVTNTTLYAGLSEIWKTTDQGDNWTSISSFAFSPVKTFRSMAVAPSDPDVIYAALNNKVFKTTVGGTTWTEITGSLPVGSSFITYVSVKDDDDLTVWVSMGEYNSHGVYESTDGGATWTNISSGLPTIPVMCVIQNRQNTSEVELYAGTDVGVYVKVGSNDWELFSNNLPNVVVTELEIYYNDASPNLSRIRAATYGRGLWQSELYSPAGLAPTSDFEADNTSPVVNQPVSFTDLTIDDPDSWFWSFDPATVEFVEGTSSTSQNPVVKFTDAGSYEVSLYTENTFGDDTETKAAYITVTTGSPTYCEAYSTNAYGYISRVEFGTIDKTSTFTNVGDPHPNDKYYEDWTALSTDVSILDSYDLTVTNGTSDTDIDLAVWIDWNQDGDFEDYLENVVCEIDNSGEGTFSIDIPSIAVLGTTRMRLRTSYFSTTCENSCGSTANGEVEDYSINIIAGDLTWEGNTSSDWATASNWNPVTVPTSSFDVTIPTSPVGAIFPEISMGTAAACNDLTIESGADVMLYGSLTIGGTFTNNAGTTGLVVKSGTSGTGSLITQTNNVDVTVERYLTGGKWHLFGAPVDNQTAEAIYFDHSPDVWLKTYIESSDDWSATITDLSTLLPMGKGFAVWVKSGENATASFEDQLNSDDFLVSSLDFTDAAHGYNLLANPFTSAIDWDQGSWARTNLDGSVWVYDPVGGSYKDRNSVGIGSLTGGIIPSSQGFFVRATSAGGSISIPANARVHSSQAFYKNSSDNTEFTIAALEVSKGEKTDEVWFAFNEASTNSYDLGWDVFKFFGDYDAPQLYAVEADEALSIDALPVLYEERIVSLNFKAGADGDHMLKLKEFENFESTELWLEDLETETLHELTFNPEYVFYADINQAPERFLLHFNPQATGIIQTMENNYSIYSWKNSVYIKNPDLASNTTIEIVDMYGRLVYQGKLHPVSLNKIDLNLSNSNLIVRLADNGNVMVQKVFIR